MPLPTHGEAFPNSPPPPPSSLLFFFGPRHRGFRFDKGPSPSITGFSLRRESYLAGRPARRRRPSHHTARAGASIRFQYGMRLCQEKRLLEGCQPVRDLFASMSGRIFFRKSLQASPVEEIFAIFLKALWTPNRVDCPSTTFVPLWLRALSLHPSLCCKSQKMGEDTAAHDTALIFLPAFGALPLWRQLIPEFPFSHRFSLVDPHGFG